MSVNSTIHESVLEFDLLHKIKFSLIEYAALFGSLNILFIKEAEISEASLAFAILSKNHIIEDSLTIEMPFYYK